MSTMFDIALFADQESADQPDADTEGNHHLGVTMVEGGAVRFEMGDGDQNCISLLCTPANARHFARVVLACLDAQP